jgi:hypothetical protein
MNMNLQVAVADVPEPVRRALYELVAYTFNENAPGLCFQITGLKAGDEPLPDYEVTIRRERADSLNRAGRN